MAETGGQQTILLTNGTISARICPQGASIMNFTVPDKEGIQRDVVLGLEKQEDYIDANPHYFGTVVGRVANRIAGATFELEGKLHRLSANEGDNTLHGGLVGLNKRVWEVAERPGGPSGTPAVSLRTTSPDGDQGFPGEVEFTVTYSLPGDCELLIAMEGRPLTQRTPISLAHHVYWNLGGHSSGTVLEHELQIHADAYTPVGPTLIPTGEIAPVEGTSLDFRIPATIGGRISGVPGGYDHNFVVGHGANDPIQPAGDGEGVVPVAAACCPETGIAFTLSTNAPGMQLYTGNFLDGTLKGKGGVAYQKHAGFCLETQGFPNAVNEPTKFPSVTVQPGEVYRHLMHFRFSCAGR